jgi:hypothetical protein
MAVFFDRNVNCLIRVAADIKVRDFLIFYTTINIFEEIGSFSTVP